MKHHTVSQAAAAVPVDGPRLRVLLLGDASPRQANTVLEHIDALMRRTGHLVYCLNPRNWPAARTIEFDGFDAVIIHYSISIVHDQYLPAPFREQVQSFRGLKAMFIQDEYREVNSYVDLIITLGIDVLFTCVPDRIAGVLYRRLLDRGVTLVPTLTGYVPSDEVEHFVKPLEQRPFDIVYRGRPVPLELGNLGREKSDIAIRVGELAGQHGVKVDVDWREEARIYGDRWIEFMASGRATLGTESGASIVDLDGSIAAAVERYRAAHPDADYRAVHRDVLAQHEGRLVLNAISPRVFEAIRLRTALILFPGEYSGILQSGRHYIELAKDYSNFADVVRRLRDPEFLERMTETAYADIIESGRYSYGAFGRTVGLALAGLAQSRGVVLSAIGNPERWRRNLDARVADVLRAPDGLAPEVADQAAVSPPGGSTASMPGIRPVVRSMMQRLLPAPICDAVSRLVNRRRSAPSGD